FAFLRHAGQFCAALLPPSHSAAFHFPHLFSSPLRIALRRLLAATLASGYRVVVLPKIPACAASPATTIRRATCR
ncbi:hypothetical protein, partial [Cupriavidus pauculus]|uniref:hypothetical protein n=1 Tax=Cupriavidus pauculus TaxID=82633 RepID=UPI001F2FE2E6